MSQGIEMRETQPLPWTISQFLMRKRSIINYEKCSECCNICSYIHLNFLLIHTMCEPEAGDIGIFGRKR